MEAEVVGKSPSAFGVSWEGTKNAMTGIGCSAVSVEEVRLSDIEFLIESSR